mmetsp:Transcript_151807/g.487123  ORF Transcript_151807/g.487123 Transcript_151807/m.487123 type:complete len:250 (+) Transcript_151807:2906-3655(+)
MSWLLALSSYAIAATTTCRATLDNCGDLQWPQVRWQHWHNWICCGGWCKGRCSGRCHCRHTSRTCVGNEALTRGRTGADAWGSRCGEGWCHEGCASLGASAGAGKLGLVCRGAGSTRCRRRALLGLRCGSLLPLRLGNPSRLLCSSLLFVVHLTQVIALSLQLLLLTYREQVHGKLYSTIHSHGVVGAHFLRERPALLARQHLIEDVAVEPRRSELLPQPLLHPFDAALGLLRQDLVGCSLAHVALSST